MLNQCTLHEGDRAMGTPFIPSVREESPLGITCCPLRATPTGFGWIRAPDLRGSGREPLHLTVVFIFVRNGRDISGSSRCLTKKFK